MTHLENQLEQLILVLSKPVVAPEDELWSASQVADYLGLAYRTVRETYIHRPGFPQPVAFPNDTGAKPELRWLAIEVKAWVKGLRRYGEAA